VITRSSRDQLGMRVVVREILCFVQWEGLSAAILLRLSLRCTWE